MKATTRIKGALAMGGISYEEFAKLCGFTRQTVYKYLNCDHPEDSENGTKLISAANKIMWLVSNRKLPLSKEQDKATKLQQLEELFGNASKTG